jgi:hypothetical protein
VVAATIVENVGYRFRHHVMLWVTSSKTCSSNIRRYYAAIPPRLAISARH